MDDVKHTPGPWEWVGRDLESNFLGHYASVIETSVSCGQFCYGGSVDLKISAADKRLIAAAPDLLNAVEKQHRAIDWLLSRLIMADPTFLPTKSAVWPLLVDASAPQVIAKATGA